MSQLNPENNGSATPVTTTPDMFSSITQTTDIPAHYKSHKLHTGNKVRVAKSVAEYIACKLDVNETYTVSHVVEKNEYDMVTLAEVTGTFGALMFEPV